MFMNNKFRLALVGAGMITQQSHLPAALASPLVDVAALVDPVADRASRIAQSYGIASRIVARIEDVLDEIDGAVIATPNDSHCPIAVACLEAGVPTLIEKPLASTYAEGVRILQAAARGGVAVAVGYSTRYRGNIKLLKTLLDENYFGDVRRFAHQFGTAGGWAPLSAYNLDRKTAGGGVLVVTGTHFLDRMLHFWGYPDDVSLEDDSAGGPEANCTATFHYRSITTPIDGIARYSKTVQLPAGLVIETERGIVVLDDNDEADITFRAHSQPDIEQVIRRPGFRPQGEKSVFQEQLEDFVNATRSGRTPVIDGRQALQSLRLIEQLYGHRRSVNVDPYLPSPSATEV
jgi:predicted dehydrogenase